MLIQSALDMVKLESEQELVWIAVLVTKALSLISFFPSKIKTDHCSGHLPSLIVFYCDALIL